MTLWQRGMDLAIRVTSLLGMAVFGLALALLTMAPQEVERVARGFVVERLTSEIERLLPGPVQSQENTHGLALAPETIEYLTKLKADLGQQFEATISKFFAGLCEFDCGKWRAVQDAIMKRLKEMSDRVFEDLKAMAQNRYSEILAKLLADFRIFSLVNLVAFAIVFAATFFMRERYAALVAPAALLLAATLLAIHSFLFGQNWLWVVVFDDYMRWSYVGMIAVFLLYLVRGYQLVRQVLKPPQ